MFKRVLPCLLAASSVLSALPLSLEARIKLITLPPRERVEVQLDHPEVTLVEEERVVPLLQGVNQVDFAWANTQINPETLVFRVLGPSEGEDNEIKVLAVSYPPGEDALVWDVSASRSGSARVRISYLLGGLDESYSYRALTSHDEATLELSQYLELANYANEEYGDSSLWVGSGERLAQSLGLGETRKVLLRHYPAVPLSKTYTSDPQLHGYLNRPQNKLRVPMHYVLRNSQAQGLGQAALNTGKVRIFQQDGKGGSAFIGEDWGRFTPLDDELKLYLGVAQDIVVVRTLESSEQHRLAGNLYNHEVVLKYELENFKDRPVTLDVVEHVRALRDELRGNNGRAVEWALGANTSFSGGPDPDKSNYDTLVFHAQLPARTGDGKTEKIVHRLHLVLKNEW